ncbi:MAG: nickel insertion protein [Lutisporaceae bacterium]
MTGEQLGYVMEQLLEAGALDVYFTHIHMKKNRPGVKLSVICSLDKQQEMTKLLLTHTSTFGVRYTEMDRAILEREFIEIQLEYGVIRCKLGRLDGKLVKIAPEYEDCKRIAKDNSLPILLVFNEALYEASKIKKKYIIKTH